MAEESGSFVHVDGLGDAWASAGVDFWRVRFGPRYVNSTTEIDAPLLTLFGKSYRCEVTVSADGTATVSQWEGLTDAARRVTVEKVGAWARDWIGTALAQTLLAETCSHHNVINADITRRNIAETETHLVELREILARLGDAGPTEYVSPYTTMVLRGRDR